MSPLRTRRRRPRSSSMLLVALGALTGLAVGAVLADRLGGLEGLLKKKTADKRKRSSSEHDHDELAAAAAADSAAVDHDYDDETDEELLDRDDDGADERVTGSGHTRFSQEHEAPDETELEERVLEAFHNDPVLAERAIDIGAIGTGVIELTGWVQASWEIGHAVTLARGVPDVTTVVDRLAVRDGEKRRDHSGRNYAGDSSSNVTATDMTASDGSLPRAD